MTEAEWAECADLGDMITALRERYCLWNWTTRRARLFSCGCCRRVWNLLGDADHAAVVAAEAVADGQNKAASLAPLRAALLPILLREYGETGFPGRVSRRGWNFTVESSAAGVQSCQPAFWTAAPTKWGGAPDYAANDARALLHFRIGPAAAQQEAIVQCQLLRDIVGPPATQAVPPLAHASGNVVALAEAVYADRAFDRLPVLADALEEAGCTVRAILDHCRAPGEHARGCWLVDWVLGKG